ncbi:MAG: aldehyde ferredoxin oxidoreductase C-terminal domain-containing protein [Deltaproteobacteria bacterium]|nr:aldehyde ferredoxin oxidoreductase C-terminal domain-containing protein [Deltaproteobacteria bacterium]
MGKRDGAIAIGPAGENQVNIANIASGHRFLGRGGMGAVMGAKHLKAVVAKGGEMRIIPRDVGKFEKIKKRATRYINRNRFTSHTYRNYGTSANVNWCNEGGILPVRNFTVGRHELAEKVSGETMARRYHTRHSTCKPCTILCGHEGTLEDGTRHGIPEYETVGLLGTNLGNFSPDQIIRYNDICNQMGMDTISAGGVLGYTMEAGEKGLIETSLRFGSDEGVADALRDMAHRRGFGDEMANGTRWLSEKYGGKSFAIQVKGLEMAAYDPRGSWGQGLSYAVANRGACHLSSTTFAPEVMFGFLYPYTTRAKAPFVVFFEDLYAGINSLQTCLFTSYAYLLEPPMVKYTPRFLLNLNMRYLPGIATRLMDVSIYSGLYGSVTGIKMSPRDFLKAGTRIHTLERFMNTREGISRRDDILPDRFLKEGRVGDPKQRVVPLDRMLDTYYRRRGYDMNGVPSLKTLHALNIEITGDKENGDNS